MKKILIAVALLAGVVAPAVAKEGPKLLGVVEVNRAAVKYVADRLGETRVGYTVSFDGTQGGSVYLPVRWTKAGPRLLEGGLGFHHQEAGVKKAFVFVGTDLQALYRATLKKWLDLGSKLEGPPLFPVFVSTWINAPGERIADWRIGSETGVQASAALLKW